MNDSAIFLDYKQQEITPNRIYENEIILSMANDENSLIFKKEVIPVDSVKEDPKKDIENILRPEKKENTEYNLIQDKNNNWNSNINNDIELINVNINDLLKLLDHINNKINSGKKIKKEDIELSNKILEEIKKRKSNN